MKRVVQRCPAWVLVGFCLVGATVVQAVLATGCGVRSEMAETTRPLLDHPAAAEVLVEARRLDSPPSLGGNRLLRGWKRSRAEGRVRWRPGSDGASLELVHIGIRDRELLIRAAEPGQRATIAVRADDRDLGEHEIDPEAVIPLPPDLPVGRVAVQLHVRPPIAVEHPVIRPVMRAGAVDATGDKIIQSPWSAVEIVRRVGRGGLFEGVLEPPMEAGENQRFEVVVDPGGPDGAKVVYRWKKGMGAKTAVEIRQPLPEGLVAIRLVARGRGGAATWRGLRITGEAGRRSADVASVKPPRLVLLYALDALRADHVGGRGWTPVLDRLAAEGVSFTDFASVAPNTITWVKAAFSGRIFLRHGPLPVEVESLAEVMAAAGYRTIGVSGNGYVSEKFGLARGFDSFEMVYPDARDADPATYVNRNAADIHRRALERLDEDPERGPTFLYLHPIHPHAPYAPPPELVGELCGGITSSVDGLSPTMLAIREGDPVLTEVDRRWLKCLYAASVAYNDARLGELVREIERRYPPEEILLIVTSDHGEEFFDHGGVLHGHTLYDELLQVPLIVRWPARLEPKIVDLPGDTFDLHETVRALVGAPPSSPTAEGRSLWPVMLGEGPPLDPRLRFAAVPTLAGGMFMARSPHTKLVWAPRSGDEWGMGLGIGRTDDPEYVFDLATDPGETNNLAGISSIETTWLRSRLRVWMQRYADHPGSDDLELDENLRRHLEALGYVE